jgi:DNA (cytosine-5)-methyltransferase 1
MISEKNEFTSLREQAGLTVSEAAARLGYTERQIYRFENGTSRPRRAVVEFLRSLKGANNSQEPVFTFIDLFAGIGGIRMGFEPLGGKCVFTCEWDKYSQKTYHANFPNDEHPIAGDIQQIHASNIPAHDLLLAGFPCQPFSIAGVSKKNALNRPHGFACETQGTLFFDLARIIEHHRPRVFLLENVRNLANHDKGRTFQVIYDTLHNQLGYHVKFRIIDAKGWVPQHRERIFIVGFRDRDDFTFDNMEVRDPLQGPKLGSILHPEDGTESEERPYTEGKKATVAPNYTLSEHLWEYLQNYAKKHQAAGNGFGCSVVGPESVTRTLSARYYKDGSEILVAQKNKAPRRLTPRECARLMGFDEPNGSSFKIPVSDTQAYKQFGNSVAVPVVKAVAQHMAPYFIAEQKELFEQPRRRA